MFYMKGRFCARYCNNVEADRKVYFESFDICISRNDDISYFTVGDSFFRLAELFVSPGFYFNDNQFTVFLCNNIPSSLCLAILFFAKIRIFCFVFG